MKRDLPAEDLHTFYARVIKRLGRNARQGEHGILEPDDATRLWSALLDERLTPPQEAAVLMGLRVHGESAAMLAAFTRETERRLTPVVVPGERALVVLQCLGTARRQPILAPLLALRIAALDVPVLVTTFDANRGANTTTVLHAMGVAPAADAAAAAAQIAAGGFAWLPVPALCPPLARLLGRRAELGFRNTAHATIKLLAPAPHAVLVANYTHAPYRASFAAAVELLKHSALLIRGTEGDPVAWEAAAHPSSAWLRGAAVELPRVPECDESADPPLPDAADVEATARFCERAARGEITVPAAVERQAQMLAALARLGQG
jgi:anthranilate phosphoribosyltransferase